MNFLDIKKLAEQETTEEELLRQVFDLFNEDTNSPLFGLMSPSERRKGKLSRVTFNIALRSVYAAFEEADAEYVYKVLSDYLHAWLAGLRSVASEDRIINPTVFRAIMMLFPFVASRVSDRYAGEFSVETFSEALSPLFERMKRSEVQKPGNSPVNLSDSFRKYLETAFSIGRGRA